MNKIYRRLWSTARQCWVVASELTAPKGKASQTVGVVALASLMLAMPPAYAQDALDEEAEDERATRLTALHAVAEPLRLAMMFVSHPAAAAAPLATYSQMALLTDNHYSNASISGESQLVLGSRAAVHGKESVVVGLAAYGNGSRNTAIGYGAAASDGGYSTAVGAGSGARGIGATALGNYAQVASDNGIAIGSGSTVMTGGGVSGIAIGGDAYAGTNGWTGAIALGGKSKADFDSIAIGYEAKTSRDGALAIGRGAQATAQGALALGKDALADESFTLSVGSKERKRRIVNVEDARLNADSTDAVAGRQLYPVKRTADSAKSTADTAKATADRAIANHSLVSRSGNSIRVGGSEAGTALTISNKDGAARYLNGVRNGALSSSSTDAVTGQQLYATNQNLATTKTVADAAKATADAAAVRLGASRLALGQDAIAEGLDAAASTAAGARAKAYNSLATAVGADARAGVDAAGNKTTASGAVALGAGTRSGNLAVTAGLNAVGTGSGAVAVGSEANAIFSDAAAVGYKAVAGAQRAAALGGQSKATAQGAVALGAGAVAGHAGGVAVGSDSQTSGNNQVSIGSAALKRKIVNVAEGTLSTSSTDAVTGRQLYATNTGVGQARTIADDAQAKANILVGLLGEDASTQAVRLGAENTGSLVDVRNKGGSSRKVSGVADGVLGASSSDAVNGKQLHATNTNVAAARSAADTAQRTADAVKVTADEALGGVTHLRGLVGEVASDGNIRLGHENSGAVLDVRNKSNGTRRLTGLSDGALGSASTEAVTGRQLHATNQLVDTQGQALLAHGQTLTAHGQQLVLQDRRIGKNRTDLDALRAAFEDFDPDLEDVVRFSADGSVDLGGGKVRGLAAGDISSAASTEAVNGGQLFATNLRLRAMEDGSRFISIGSGGDQEASQAGEFGLAIGDASQASLLSEGGVAVGAYALAMGKNSVALGRAARVDDAAEGGFALGVRSRVKAAFGIAIGPGSQIEDGAAGAIAIGHMAVADRPNTVSFGTDSQQRRIVNVAAGYDQNDATTASQLRSAIQLFGAKAGLDGMGNVISPGYQVQGAEHETVGSALTALDGAVFATGSRVDQLDSWITSAFQKKTALSDGTNVLALSGADGIRITNLTDGTIAADSRDAVTGGQLFEARQQIHKNREDLDELRETGKGQAWFVDSISFDAGAIDFNGSRLTGVGMGGIGPSSTDVVVGSQLHATNIRIEPIEAVSRFISVGEASRVETPSSGYYGLALGNGAQAALVEEGGTAVGSYTSALGMNSVALGRGAYVGETAMEGFALGAGSRVQANRGVAIGGNAVATALADRAVAIGAYSVADERDTVSIGNSSTKRRIVNLANGRNAADAATIGQLRGALSPLGAGIDADGNVSHAGFTTQGQHHASVGEALSALDSSVTTNATRVSNVETHLSSIFASAPTIKANGIPQLTLAGAQGMVLSNVASGLVAAGSRDAVNGGQLHAVQQQLNGRMDGLEQRVDGQPQARVSRTATTDETAADNTPQTDSPQVTSTADAPAPPPTAAPVPKADAPQDVKPQVDTADLERMLARANEYTDGISREVDARLDKMDKRFNRMAAMNSAQAAMAMNTAGLATYNRLGAGVGYSDGESAVAVGYQRVLNDKGSATFSLNGAFTNSGERTVGVGVGIGW